MTMSPSPYQHACAIVDFEFGGWCNPILFPFWMVPRTDGTCVYFERRRALRIKMPPARSPRPAEREPASISGAETVNPASTFLPSEWTITKRPMPYQQVRAITEVELFRSCTCIRPPVWMLRQRNRVCLLRAPAGSKDECLRQGVRNRPKWTRRQFQAPPKQSPQGDCSPPKTESAEVPECTRRLQTNPRG